MILGTRSSTLALRQAHAVRKALERCGVPVEMAEYRTVGDRILDVPLAAIGDKGLFTKELDLALLAGEIHLAVHSLKDLPTLLPEGLCLAAVSDRESPWDVFIAHPSFTGTLDDLPIGATIATSSLRRQAQLLAWRPDLHIESVRGNVETRLRKLDESRWHGIILAEAGLVRLGLSSHRRERIPMERMLPAVGQGALGVVCSNGDAETCAVVEKAIHHPDTAACTRAERAFLRKLEGGCQVPIGALGKRYGDTITLHGCVATLDGRSLIRDTANGPVEAAESVGEALAGLLLERGAGAVLHAIRTP